jgi:hypothetical protein
MSDLTNFLSDNPIIQITLTDAKPVIDRIFGRETRLIVMLEEDECCQKSVEAHIQWEGEGCEGFNRLEQFDKEFWLERAREVGGILMFDVRLVEPERLRPASEPRKGEQ